MRHRASWISRTALLAFGFSSAAGAAVHQVNVGPANVFSPADITIAVGDTVRFTRLGGYHTVIEDNGAWSSPLPGAWLHYTPPPFNTPGNVEYYCDQHSEPNGNTMNGIIRVQGGGGGGAGSLQFTVASTSVGEGAGNVTINVQRINGDDGAVSVEYFTADGSAQQPGDYTQTNGVLNWPDNDDNNKSFQVPIVNDGDTENNEQFTINLENPTGGATLGNRDTITVTINDNDGGGGGGPGTIRMTQAARTVAENAGSISIVAERVGGSTGAVSVSYATANGSAGAPGDYGSASGTLNWGDGDGANKSFPVSIVNDSNNEGDETFTATLSNPTGGASLGTATTTVTIDDDDTVCVPSVCVPGPNTLCLAGGSGTPGRFEVSVIWTDFEDNTGPGVALSYTADSGFFYFFNNQILELLVKIVNGCGFNNSYWFYYGSTSNVGLVYTVKDLQTCRTRTVSVPRGTFASNGDIEFFDTSCP